MTMDTAWYSLLHEIMASGQLRSPRGELTREIIAHQIQVNMSTPILTVPQRRLGYKFMAAEAYWILTGDNRAQTITPYSKHIGAFSDDGIFFRGAYGPLIIDQLPYVLESLALDHDTRQAVIDIWRPSPRASKDIPCTLSVQFLIRDGYLHCIDTMRSSDAWLGVPYDVFNFTMLTYYVSLLLRKMGVETVPGQLVMQAGSQHLYQRNWKAVDAILKELYEGSQDVQLDISDYRDVQDLLEWLAAGRDIGIDKVLKS